MIQSILLKSYKILNSFLFRFKGVIFGENLMVIGKVKIVARGQIRIGDDFSLISGNHYNPLARNIQSCIRADNNAKITIGNNVGMSCISIWSKKEITIGDNVKLGADVIVLDSDMHSLNYIERRIVSTDAINANSANIVIEDDVFIGTRSIINKGVNIGQKSIIAAGSVVNKSIPKNEVWGGNPAKFIKKITSH